ncbi:MAG: helix-turn-helix transcriptional regulator [Caulobacteraceae bacterium]|nr:helix-turn-helix transcriptional regulator [Caulobacteraceae bacterium]
MKFGDYLKNRRTELGWTQPEAAAKASIEQSYLSKLETGKSFPSEDVYARLVEAFSLDTEAMVGALYPAELDRLREIEAVRKHLLQREHDTRSVSRRWLYAGLGGLILGGALIGLAQVDRGGAATHYTYQSEGVIRAGETANVFDDIDDNPQLRARADERQIFIPEMRGPAFTETVPDGRREWHLVGANAVLVPAKFGWALIPGFALLIGGLGCFFISWRRP